MIDLSEGYINAAQWTNIYYSVHLFDKNVYIILYPEAGVLIFLQQYFDIIINDYNCSALDLLVIFLNVCSIFSSCWTKNIAW